MCERPPDSRILVPVLVFVGMVVAVVSSLGAPLIPTIARVDHVTITNAQWSLTIALLVGAVATPVMGRLADGPHRRALLLSALAVVLVGCVLAALPYGFGVLIVGRALQGVGLGLVPVAIAVARDRLSSEQSRSAVALLSITTVAGVGLGYPVTGLISEHLSLDAGYWFGAIVTALALVLAFAVVPSSAHLARSPLDLRGAGLLGASLAGLLLAVSEAETWGWTSGRLLVVSAASLVLLVGWVVHELRSAHPLVDLRLIRHRTVLTADVTALFGGVAMYLLLSTVTRFVQTPASAGYGFGSSIAVAGLALLPFSVGSVAASRVAPLIARRTSAEAVLPIGCLMLLAALASFLLARNSLWEVFVCMGLAGLGVGCTFASLPGLIVRSVPAHETGSATSFNQVLRMVGFSIGSAMSATVLAAYTRPGQLLPAGAAYSTVAALGCGVAVLTAAASFLLPRLPARRPADRRVAGLQSVAAD